MTSEGLNGVRGLDLWPNEWLGNDALLLRGRRARPLHCNLVVSLQHSDLVANGEQRTSFDVERLCNPALLSLSGPC
jgi:hypothetical protein